MQNDKRLNQIFAFLAFLISTIVYLKTIAPTTSFWDCGEFITSAYILGVPHPPGAPFFLLVGRLFSMIPFAQDIGLRVNVISAFSSSLTVMFTYLIIVRLIIMYRGKAENLVDKITIYAGAFIGSLTFAFTDSFWFNAVEAEVYAISMLFTALVIWLILVWYEKADRTSSDKYIILIAYAIGLVIGVHLLSILALPPIFLLIYFRKTKKPEWKSFFIFSLVAVLAFVAIYPGIVKKLPNSMLLLNNKFGSEFTTIFFIGLLILLFLGLKSAVDNKRRYLFLALTALLLILMGVSTYTTIYLRSNLNPELDENDPETMANMVNYLNREQYGDWGTFPRRYPGLISEPEFNRQNPYSNYSTYNFDKQLDFMWNYQIKKMFIRYFGWQFFGQGQTLGEDDRIVETLSPYGLFMLPFILGLIGMIQHFRKNWQHASFVMMLFLMTGIAIVIYLNQEDPQPRERDYVYTGSYMAFALWIGIGVQVALDYMKKLSAKYSKNIKTIIVATTAVIFLFILPVNLLAFNYTSHNRSGNYVAFDYSYNILESCEPNAILFTNGDNDTFPLWFLQFVYGIRKDVRVVNLSLLNTHWYIKQLRDEEPKVPISLSDNSINKLQPIAWDKPKTIKIDVPKEAYLHDLGDLFEKKQLMQEVEEEPQIVFQLEPTLYGQGIRVQDLMIIEIIRTNKFRRPFYFALTVSQDNQINLNNYLRMDGLVYKLITYPGEVISPPKLKNNLLHKFQYRNLNTTDVYYNENIKGLLRNYQGSYYSLARFYHRENHYDDLVEVLDTLFTVMPDTVIPMRHELLFQFAKFYEDAGASEKGEKILQRILNRTDVNLDNKLQYVYFFYPREEEKKSIDGIKKIVTENPDYANGVYWLTNYYMKEKQFQTGLDLIDQWLAAHPDDKTAGDFKKQIQSMARLTKADTTALKIVKPDSQKNH